MRVELAIRIDVLSIYPFIHWSIYLRTLSYVDDNLFHYRRCLQHHIYPFISEPFHLTISLQTVLAQLGKFAITASFAMVSQILLVYLWPVSKWVLWIIWLTLCGSYGSFCLKLHIHLPKWIQFAIFNFKRPLQVWQYGAEIFPTQVRNIGVSFSSFPTIFFQHIDASISCTFLAISDHFLAAWCETLGRASNIAAFSPFSCKILGRAS